MSQVSDYTSYQNSLKNLRDSYESERANIRKNADDQVDSAKQESQETLETAKKDYNSRLQDERAQAREDVRKLKDELYDQHGKSATNDSKEILEERKSFSKYHDEVQKNADKRIEEARDYASKQGERDQKMSEGKVEEALALQKKSHHQEVNDLQDQLRQYSGMDRDVEAEKADASRKVVRDYEHAHADEKERIVTAYDRQLKAAQQHNEDLKNSVGSKVNDAEIAANVRAQDQVRAQKENFTQIQRDQARVRDSVDKNHELEVNALKNRGDHATEHLVSKNSDDLNRALDNKDKTYLDYIAKKEEITSQKISERDEKIKELQTTGDPLKVSPFVMEKINNAAEKRNHESLTVAQTTHQKNLDAVRARAQEDKLDLISENKEEIATMARASRQELDVQTRQVRSSMDDLQDTRTNEVSDLKESKRKLADTLYRKNAMELDTAQKVKKEALEDQREALIYDKRASLDDAQQNMRTQDREWFLKVNDLRRNFEAKLNDEREEHEKKTVDIKLESDKKLRESERQSKRILDDRVRSYEHQITQQELAFKEKERFLTERYEQDLDKMKRTNAHLIEKKS